ncbi:MAG TPA: MFS transporter [Clostridia bacterium]|nr:MFS transporter [Clostridia bacterium]HRX41352.1 MFS transporter [Clostridia bacterium]
MNKLKGYWSRQKAEGYITNKQKFQLAFPQMPLAISNGLIHSAYIKFYTDIIGLDIKYVGIIWLLFGIWNAINDPLMGIFIDRFKFKPKRGKYTYLLRVTAPITVLSAAAMLYAQPDWPTWLTFGFLAVLLFIFDTTQTGYAISYGNYILVAAASNEERLDVSVIHMYAGQLGAFLSMIIPTLLLVGDVNKTLVVVLFTLVILINSLLYFFALKPLKETPEMFRDIRTDEGKLVEQLKQDARSLVKSRPFITYLLYQIVGRGATVILFTQLLYMADHVLGMKGIQTTLLDVVPGLVMFLFLPLFPRISKVTGMRNLLILASIPLGLSYMALYFVNGFWSAMIVYIFIIVFTNVNVVGGPLFGAIIDEDERRTGTRKAGLFTGMNALLTIPVGGLHTLIFTSILAFYGFTSGADVQSETAVYGIRMASSFLPGILILLGMIPLFLMPINKNVEKELSDFSVQMHRENKEKHAARTVEE